ncbi:MAG: HAMP domain-containing histidine kinase, partial [Myxococcales bacterium]|nr:HAMP domain-containing histidine kinase [Myxococcales bacterium]
TLQRLTTIGGRRAAARETLDLNDWLRDLPPRLRAALGNGALLVTARCAETCPVRLDIALLDELVLGLAARAREVAPRGQVTVESWRRSGEVGLDVSDEGPTQTEGQLAAMFQPYGLITDDGLRLAACQGLARTLGGRLEVKNRAGGGVTFTLVVPAL